MLGLMGDYWYWVFAAPGLLLGIWAQIKVKMTFMEMSKRRIRSDMTGAEAARAVLDSAGLRNVPIEPIPGMLSDHYDPRKRVLRLSEAVYGQRSAAAVGVAAHEAGHAVQHAAGYAPMMLRAFMAPAVIVGSWLTPVLFIVGAFLMYGGETTWGPQILLAAVCLFAATTLFALVTLPVEFDASSRALKLLPQAGVLTMEEVPAAKKVLTAAALTYVAAAIQSVMTLLYYLWRMGLIGGRRN
jgi:uncharacterized protein